MRVLSHPLLHVSSKYLSAASQNGVSSSGAPVRKEGVLMQDGERLYISYGKKVFVPSCVCACDRTCATCVQLASLRLCVYLFLKKVYMSANIRVYVYV
jgi:hypothetical protein